MRRFIFFFFLLSALAAVFFWYDSFKEQPRLPLELLGKKDELPVFRDDLERASLLVAAQHHKQYLLQLPETYSANIAELTVPRDNLLGSVQELISELLTNPSAEELNYFIRDRFAVYKAGGRATGKKGEMLVTGYFEPFYEARLQPENDFMYPIYSRPDALLDFPKQDLPGGVGRIGTDGIPVPFWARSDIEDLKLLEGYELAYLKDPFDVFLLHVQGSGRLLLKDGQSVPVRFSASNGLEYKSIGKFLVDQNIFELKDVSIPAIRNWLKENPEQRKALLHHNPRYTFFSWGTGKFPRGSTGVELTPGRSIATDRSQLPGDLIGYIITRKPIIDGTGNVTGWNPMNRFVFPQDSGAAIQGPGRVDMFWGAGPYAKAAAGAMHETGELYFLISKRELAGIPLSPVPE